MGLKDRPAPDWARVRTANGQRPDANGDITVTASVVPSDDGSVQEDIDQLGDDLAAHLADPEDAHDASAISYDPAGNDIDADDVQAALEDLDTRVDLDSTKAAEWPPNDAAVWLPASMGDITVSPDAADRQVAVAATEAWEQDAIQEATVWFAGGRYHMTYTGGWDATAIGYARADHPEGPWVKHSSNPILGLGDGGEAGSAARPSHFIDDDGEHYTYYAEPYSGSGTVDLMVATGHPPNIVKVGVALAHTATATAIQNSDVVKHDGVYHMIFESHVETGGFWQLGYATATDPLGPFTIDTFPLTDLQLVADGLYSGPCLRRNAADDGWVLVYHAGETALNVPNDIYRATSTDLTTWTVEPGPLVERVVDPPEGDQVADPWYLVADYGGFLFWEGVDNVAETSSIMVSRVRGIGDPQWFDGQTWQTEWPSVGDVTQAELDAETDAREVADAALAADIAALESAGAHHYEVLMSSDGTATPLTNSAGDDWLYGLVAD